MQRMKVLARLRNAPRTVAKAQRRLWLIQLLPWPTLILSGVTVLVAVVLWRRRTTSDGRHELPETPGAHRADADDTTASNGFSAH
jgi:hypothetical protein